jgi:hypothetical protein
MWYYPMTVEQHEKTLRALGIVLTKLIDGEMTVEEMKEAVRENTWLLKGDECRYGDASEYYPRDIALGVADLEWENARL